MIISYINGEWKEPGSLCQAIGIFKENFHKTVSVVGGGGKTTVIRRLMDECRNAGIPCAVSTTTHIQKCDAGYFWETFGGNVPSDYDKIWCCMDGKRDNGWEACIFS